MSDQVKDLLDQIVKLQTEQSYHKEDQDDVTAPEALGIALSQYFKWDGQQIFATASSRYEESNFHSFNGEFQKLWERSN